MPNFDAIRIGVIKKIKGEAIAIGRDGTMRVLHKGDEIYLGDDIKTSENSNLTIVFDDGEKAYVGFSSVFHTINVFAEHKGELVIPKNANILENHKEHANDDDQISHQELSPHGSSSHNFASVGSSGIKFELGATTQISTTSTLVCALLKLGMTRSNGQLARLRSAGSLTLDIIS